MTGKQLKLRGMALAAEKHNETLSTVRGWARYVANRHSPRPISINEVRAQWEALGQVWDLGNAAGSIFKGDEWEWMGFTHAKHPSGHSRMVRTWRLKP